MWVDPNLSDFYERLGRIEKAHAKGYGFEAPGTVVRKPPSASLGLRLLRLLKPLMLMAALGIGLKGTILYFIGPQTYDSRLGALAAGTGIDPVGAWLMYPDPLTVLVAEQLQVFAPR
jgi:hypothetical protein